MSHDVIRSQNMIIFWLGLLTGALIVSLIFLYATYQAQNIQDLILFGSGSNLIQEDHI